MSSSLETEVVGLDLRLYVTKAMKNSVKELLGSHKKQGKVSRMEETCRSLEMEKAKMEVFKRELPLSVQVISHALELLKEELEHCQRAPQELTTPTKKKLEEKGAIKVESECNDKMNWMSSAQLWSHSFTNQNNKNTTNNNNNNNQKENQKAGVVVPDLSLSSPVIDSTRVAVQLQHQQQHPVVSAPQRKARRCWSPELHRRFVAALKLLGGAQVATPKQMRKLMKVDGLTNDEIKSHLQKYRLHTRRMPMPVGNVDQTVVMAGCSQWASHQENYTKSQHSTCQFGYPQGPLQLAGSSRAVSVTAGDSCEDEEDGRSESYKLEEWVND